MPAYLDRRLDADCFHRKAGAARLTFGNVTGVLWIVWAIVTLLV